MAKREEAIKPKRYSLVLPQELYDEIDEIAKARNSAVVEVIKQFLRLGVTLVETEKSPDTSLILRRRGEPDVELKLV